MMTASIHATALVFGHRGILIRGPAGSGKSALALSLLQSADGTFSRLVGDDRIQLEAAHGRLLMRPAAALQGLIECRGIGILRVPFEPVAMANLVVDLAAPDAQRLPLPEDLHTNIEGVQLARLPVAQGPAAQFQVRAFLAQGTNFSALLDV